MSTTSVPSTSTIIGVNSPSHASPTPEPPLVLRRGIDGDPARAGVCPDGAALPEGVIEGY
jgi:hypothetical protein